MRKILVMAGAAGFLALATTAALADGPPKTPQTQADSAKQAQDHAHMQGMDHGAASRLLGVLAAAMGSWELAEGHFINALAMHERMGARPWLARTQLAYAERLPTRRRRGDKARARELLGAAVVMADALGMGVVTPHARDLVPAGAAGPGGAIAGRLT